MLQFVKSSFAAVAAVGLLVTSGAMASTPNYKVDSSHSNVTFEIRHLLSKVKGSFGEFEGTFYFDDKKMAESNVEFKIKTASISTNNAKRDEHLRGDDFFSTAKFPEITFKSKKVSAAGKNQLKVVGEMTMRGVTKEVTWDVEFLGTAKDPFGRNLASFSATSKINRKDFGVSYNKVADNGGLVVGDEVKMEVLVEGERTDGEKKAEATKGNDKKPEGKK